VLCSGVRNVLYNYFIAQVSAIDCYLPVLGNLFIYQLGPHHFYSNTLQ